MQSDWQILIFGSLLLLFLFIMQPGIKAAFSRSRQAKSDWQSVLLPIILVVFFVFLLIAIV